MSKLNLVILLVITTLLIAQKPASVKAEKSGVVTSRKPEVTYEIRAFKLIDSIKAMNRISSSINKECERKLALLKEQQKMIKTGQIKKVDTTKINKSNQ